MSDLRTRLRSQLTASVRARERPVVQAIRSALAAMENAEAVDAVADRPVQSGPDVVGAVLGVGAADVARREIPAAEELMIVLAEIDDLRRAATTYADAGMTDRATDLTRGADALAALVS